ncbi:MAG: 50S ribosomal protein L22 [Candidatus Margulisiibacteriota bacterium]
MNVKTTIKYLRISPRKVHRVMREIVGKPVSEALKMLKFLPHHSARIIYNVVKSAQSNAVHNYKLNQGALIIAEGHVGQALIMKRVTPMSRGRGGAIQKKLSHITVTLKEGDNHGAKN